MSLLFLAQAAPTRVPASPVPQIQTIAPNPAASSDPSPVPTLEQAPILPTLPRQMPLEMPRQIEVVRSQDVRALPGQLNEVPVFNSNSPEAIQSEGILLSTFPPETMQVPSAHLNYAFNGSFDLFAHHVAKGLNADDNRTMYVGVVVYNPGDQPVTLEILQAVSYLSQDAPFLDLPAYVANPMGTVFAGPGSRTTTDILRGQRQPQWPTQITIPPKRVQLLLNMPIPLRRLTVPTDGTLPPGYLIPGPIVAAPSPAATLVVNAAGNPASNPASSPAANPPRPSKNRDVAINGRTILMHLSSSAPVYMASLAMHAPTLPNGAERVPSLAEWVDVLTKGGLAEPRDRPPSPPDSRNFVRFFYGRVSGVSQGSQWETTPTDNPDIDYLSIPQPGRSVSYVISTVDRNTFGTGQIQSAPMLVRYPDTAYRAHGNYGVRYNVTLPLYNNTDSAQKVAVMLQTPVQSEQAQNALKFREPPDNLVFFRGTVRLRYTNDFGFSQTRYLHLVQRRGQEGEPLLQLTLPKGDRRSVEVEFVYPPDATPPQVLTVQTIEQRTIAEMR
ncbi:MAG: DUF3370 domain-containing protein [Drouetiella hepatica Uher 2000/2452]|uniref:DUF3370 domain-containing protein n=1 Tax=Drouetiella hepatica Uher 2000/2452 TaxID=904376 RepID=A0A951UN06_9CYAN|nr:DUF3370 domain-containing protein [Drouetiella hepatica Uher 2000/2452]